MAGSSERTSAEGGREEARAREEARGRAREAWALARRQHGVITRGQLLELGFSAAAIDWRVARGRLRRVARGVYSVWAELDEDGRRMVALRACGPGAALSHGSAAAFWRIGREPSGWVEVSVPRAGPRRRSGIRVHRRPALAARDFVISREIRVTTPLRTMIDMAAGATPDNRLERAVNEADKYELIDLEEMRADLDGYQGQPGVPRLAALIDRHTFRLSDDELERMFRPLAHAVGLPVPETKVWVNNFEVDFYWPALGLVVETDGLKYHRTPAEQNQALLRQHAHAAAGMIELRFSHHQIAHEPEYVRTNLATVARRLEATAGAGAGAGAPGRPGATVLLPGE